MSLARAWRTQECDWLTLITSVHAKIILICRDDGMAGKQLAHAYETKVREIRLAILIAIGQFRQPVEISIAIESQQQHIVIDQRQHSGY